MFILLYFIYVFTAGLVQRLIVDMNINPLVSDLVMSGILIVFTIIILNRWFKKFNYKETKEAVGIVSLNPMRDRVTNMPIQLWAMIYIIPNFMGVNNKEMNFAIFYYINTIISLLLILMFAYPILVEANIGLRKIGLKKVIMYGILGYIVSIGLDAGLTFIQEALGLIQDVSLNQDLVNDLVLNDRVRMFIDVTFSAAITEELVYRGLYFRTLVHRNRTLAYLVTFIVFGFIHVVPGLILGKGASELWFLPLYGISGLVMAYIYEKTECIYSPMITHFLNNFIAFVLI